MSFADRKLGVKQEVGGKATALFIAHADAWSELERRILDGALVVPDK